MTNKVRSLLHQKLREVMEDTGIWTQDLVDELPKHWESHGDLVLFPARTFANENWKKTGNRVWEAVCAVLHKERIARKLGPTQKDEYRRPRVELLYGDDPWVTKKENGIKYTWDITKVMFSSGNISEKQRIGSWDCSNQVVLDLYAGIGYFTLSYLIHAKAAPVYSIEWNPDSILALQKNLCLNGVENKCIVLPGNNLEVCPRDVEADHVNLGLLPSSEKSWPVACGALSKSRGGILHIHGNVDLKIKEEIDSFTSSQNPTLDPRWPIPWSIWAQYVQNSIQTIFSDKTEDWKVEILGIYKVKSYGPNVDHLVVDIKCTPIL